MEAAVKAIGYDNLQVKSPYPLVNLTELKIVNQPNEHATLYYTGVIAEGMAGSYIAKARAGDAIEVVQVANGAGGMTLFSGQVCQIKIKNRMGIAYLEVEAISWTFDLDVKVKSRSFQDKNMRYTELMRQVIADYSGAAFSAPQFQDGSINEMVVQYLETDWQFLMRVASQTGAVLIADTTQANPRFWLGLPDSRAAEIKAVEYTVMRDLESYAEAIDNYQASVNEDAFTGYKVTSWQYFVVGARVNFQGKDLRVARSSAVMRDGILQFEYILLPQSGIRQNPMLNPKLSGASIEGKIIDRAKDTVKVHLAIDAEQPKEAACWLPYASFYTAEGNSGWYCMPELGDSVQVCFRDCHEGHAIVTGSVRKGGQSNEKMTNPNVKYLGNSVGKEMMLGENAVTFTASSKTGRMALKVDQGQGVEVQSDQELLIYSDQDVRMEIEHKLAIQAEDGIYLSCNASSIILDGETDIQGTQVAIEGVGPPPVVKPAELAPAAEQEVAENDNSETILDAIQLGLDVIGLIPVVGSFADIANAGVSAARGDWWGAGLSLVAAIPIVGDIATGGKLAAKGASLATKAVTKAPKLTKAAKVVGKGGLAALNAYSAVGGIQEAGGHLADGNWLKAGRALVNGFAAGKALTRSRKIKGKVPDMEGLGKKMKGSSGTSSKRVRRKTGHCYRRNTKSKHCLGDPVDAIIGEVIVDRQDFTVPGRIPIHWNCHYGSQSKYQGLCGRGWETPGDIRLEFNPDGTVLFQDGSGAPSCFNFLPVETPVLEPVDGRLLQREDGFFTVRLQEGVTYYFPIAQEPADRIRVDHIADPYGNTVQYVWDNQGLREIRDSGGRRIEVTSKQGRIEAMHLGVPGNPSQLLVRYEYDEHGNLTTVYDALDVPYRFYYQNNLLIRHSNRNGLSFYYEYDQYTAEGRCIHTWGDDGLYEERFSYHDDQRVVEATGTLGTTTFIYDERYLVLAEADPLGGVTKYEYDEYGRTVAVVDPDGHRTEYIYDHRGNLLKLIRPDGIAITTEYSAEGKPLRVTDPNGVTWKQEWDVKGQLIRQISPLGAVTQYRYDEYGQLTEFVDPLGSEARLGFDTSGNLISLTDALGRTTRFSYDFLGRLITRIDPLKRRTDYQYDRKGRLVKAVLPGGNTVTCQYDAEDNLIVYTDENGAVTRLEYCGVNELKRRIQPDGQTVEYEYNQEEQLIAVINQRGERYELKRDPVGRIIEEVDYWGQSRKYRYSPAGYLQESTDPLGQTIRYKTDPLGRILEKTLPGTDQTLTESFQYDANGNLIACANRESQVKRSFDLEGKLVEEQQGADCRVVYQYDLNGTRISRTVTLKDGTAVRSHTVNYRYDSLGQATEVQIEDRQPVQFSRNARGQVIREVLGGQLKRWSEYDQSGYLIRQTVGANSGPVFEQEYSYDKTGNLLQKSDSVLGTDKFFYDTMGRIVRQIDPMGQVQQFLYDPAGDRLTTRIVDQGSEDREDVWSRSGEHDHNTYCFNRAGNLVSRVGKQGNTEFIWDANQRLVASIQDGQQTTYRYDPLGRRISKTTAGVETRFYWDGDALLGDLRFEPEGKQKTDEHPKLSCTRWREWIYYPGSFEPLAMVQADTLDKDNGPAERIYYYANDPNGCPTRLLDESGKIVWAVLYDAWGKVKQPTLKWTIKNFPVNEVEQPLRLQGQYFDEETGLHYNRFRYYEPRIGSFISKDPLGLFAGENMYAFLPNTLTWIDPWGLIIVYRALNGPQEADALAGRTIQPKDINASYTMQEHIDNGSLNTQYISTTKKADTAEFYAKPNPKRGKLTKSTIIEVDTDKLDPGKVFDMSSGIDPQTGDKLKNPAYRYATKDAEVLIEGPIPKHAYKKKGCS